jgi:pyocin large subunit-like protein
VKIVVLALAAAIVIAGCEHRREDTRGPAVAATGTDASQGAHRNVGFHTARQLAEHFEKHGSEFGDISRQEYLVRAQELRDAPVSGTILESVRNDGVITRFDRKTGAFIAFDGDGTIRTFFRPNDGEAYFRRQARRQAAP